MFDFVSGDTGSSIVITCTDKVTGLPINLTGSTVALNWVGSSGTVVNKAMTVVSAAQGKASYHFLANELFAPKMSLEVVISTGADVVSNLDLIQLSVREQVA